MSIRQTKAWGAIFACVLGLTGCGGGGGGSVAPPPPPSAGNNVVASWSLNGTVQVITGGSQSVSVSFSTDDGKAVTNLQVPQAALPAGWSAANVPLSCAQVAIGNGCVLVLNYAPTVTATGMLSIAYSYTDSVSKARTGSATINFGATAHNNVNLTVVPVGQVTTKVGASQTVTVLFATDDGSASTNLQVTSGLTNLPAGWTTPASTFSCATVSSGNGCLLALVYAPGAAGSGTVNLGFSYTDNAAVAQTGSITLQYASSNDNNVVATTSPLGQVTALINSPSTAVGITFTTDDGQSATNLQVSSGLGAALPAGWTGPNSYSCAAVSTGSGCHFNLSYSPTGVGSGALPLSYHYVTAGGATKTGTIVIPYAATSDNNVKATADPTGQINALTGSSGLDVRVTFTTDDQNQASNLIIVSGLAALPAGWTGPSTFACAGFATGNGCQLTLRFAPPAVESGSVNLNYTYTSNSGAVKAGSVSLPYQSTTHNNLVVTRIPSGQVTAVLNQGTQPVDIAFTTDDGNPVTSVNITSGLTGLPTDWTVLGSSTLPCASAAAGTGCMLSLQFKPTVRSSGTISLGYAYTDNAGAAQTGTIDVPYASIPTYFYANKETDTVLRCAANFDGTLSGCSPVATGFKVPYGLAFNGKYVYIADSGDTLTSIVGSVKFCPVNADGTFGKCIAAAPAGTFSVPKAITASGGFLYVADADGSKGIQVCPIKRDGSLDLCAQTAGSVATPLDVPDGIAVVGGMAYIVDLQGAGSNLGNLTTCSVNGLDGTLIACDQKVVGTTPSGLAVYNGNLYVGTGDNIEITVCPIGLGGSVGTCAPNVVSAGFAQAVGFGFVNGFAYVSGFGGSNTITGGIAYCPLNMDGSFGSCLRGTDKLIKNIDFFGMAAH